MRISGKTARLFAAGALFAGLAFAALAGEARAQLYGSDELGNLFTFDVTTGATTPIGAPNTLYSGSATGCCTEIEYDNTTGRAWAQERASGYVITEFDINTGLLIGPAVPDGAAFNGLEYVGSVLYGVFKTGGLASPSTLAILNPATGAFTVIGPTGAGSLAGLAWDGATGTMYAVGSPIGVPPPPASSTR